MVESITSCKEVMKHDDLLLNKLFWEFDAQRCGHASTSELNVFKSILKKYGNYAVSSLFDGRMDFYNKPCEGKKTSKKECKGCKLKDHCGM